MVISCQQIQGTSKKKNSFVKSELAIFYQQILRSIKAKFPFKQFSGIKQGEFKTIFQIKKKAFVMNHPMIIHAQIGFNIAFYYSHGGLIRCMEQIFFFINLFTTNNHQLYYYKCLWFFRKILTLSMLHIQFSKWLLLHSFCFIRG